MFCRQWIWYIGVGESELKGSSSEEILIFTKDGE
jgi:hypothetical protein